MIFNIGHFVGLKVNNGTNSRDLITTIIFYMGDVYEVLDMIIIEENQKFELYNFAILISTCSSKSINRNY